MKTIYRINSRNIRTSVSIGILAIGLTLSGCQNTSGIQVKHGTATTIQNFKFDNNLEIDQAIGSMNGELYSGAVIVKNNASSTKALQYQFTWYDNQNIEIDANSHGWTPLTIYGNDEKTVKSVAPSPTATQFKVSIRELKATKVFKTNLLGRL